MLKIVETFYLQLAGIGLIAVGVVVRAKIADFNELFGKQCYSANIKSQFFEPIEGKYNIVLYVC